MRGISFLLLRPERRLPLGSLLAAPPVKGSMPLFASGGRATKMVKAALESSHRLMSMKELVRACQLSVGMCCIPVGRADGGRERKKVRARV